MAHPAGDLQTAGARLRRRLCQGTGKSRRAIRPQEVSVKRRPWERIGRLRDNEGAILLRGRRLSGVSIGRAETRGVDLQGSRGDC